MPKVVLSFLCPEIGCGNPIREPLEVSEANLMAERMSDGDAIERHDICCDECGADHEVETVSSIGGVTATLTPTGQEIDADVEHVPDYDDFLNAYQPGEDILEDYRQARSDLLVLLRREGQDGHSIQPDPCASRSAAINQLIVFRVIVSSRRPPGSDANQA